MITLKGKNILAEIPLDECSYFTKWAIAIDTSTSPELLRVLSEDKDERILYHCLSNPNFPVDLMEKYVSGKKQSDDCYMYTYIKNYRTDSKYNDAVVEYSPSTTTVIAENPSCPSDLLKKIAESCDEDEALSICKNRNISKDVLDIILSKFSDNEMITQNIAENPSCPSDLLKKIAESCDEDGALCVCNNSSVTKDILDILSVRFTDDDMIVENIENALNQM